MRETQSSKLQQAHLCISFFFLRIVTPPRSTLFPYTTLFRSVCIVAIASASSEPPHIHPPIAQVPSPIRETVRSEEHTSELQSLRHLVCRLLLEKKKQGLPFH